MAIPGRPTKAESAASVGCRRYRRRPQPTTMGSLGYRIDSKARGLLIAYAIVIGPRRPTTIAVARMNNAAGLSSRATPTE